MAKVKMKKVVAEVSEEYVEPDYTARWKCPYCKAFDFEQVYEGNCTETKICDKCSKKYKVKIPNF